MVAPSGERLRGKGRHDVIAGKTERLECEVPQKERYYIHLHTVKLVDGAKILL